MAEQLICRDSPAAPPRHNPTQTPTIQHIHDAPRGCVGVQPAMLERLVELGQRPYENAVRQVEPLDRGVAARSNL